jgi:hypothetical protein
MKKSFLIGIALMLALSFEISAQYDNNVAVGIRIGEPLGINVRKYFQYGDKAFDVNFGTYGFLYGKDRVYRKGAYSKSGLMVQGIYSWHYGIGSGDALKAYYGFGGQINFREYVSEENLIGTRQNGDKQLSLGPTVNAGAEYNLPGNDIGVFIDAGGYAELAPGFLFMHPQFSAGVRVNLVGNK